MINNDVEKFQQMLLEMRRSFVAELPERFEIIEELVIKLEGNPADRNVFDELYRHVHSLKGAGGTHGLVIITKICHQMENILGNLIGIDFDNKATGLVLDYIDMLRRVAKRSLLPDEDFSDIQDELEHSREKLAQGNSSILIAESSLMMAKLCQKTLQNGSVRLALVSDGLSALQSLVHDRFDLLVIGRELSQLNGIAVVAALRMSSNNNSKIPVILLTSNLTQIDKGININSIIVRDQHLTHHLAEMTKRILPNL